MNRKELTKTFMMILNGKKPLASKVFIIKFGALRVKVLTTIGVFNLLNYQFKSQLLDECLKSRLAAAWSHIKQI